MKIDAPRVMTATLWAMNGRNHDIAEGGRWVRESDWRKIMAVVRAADKEFTAYGDGVCSCGMEGTHAAYVALRKHLERKRK